jgi:tetratricopeptide (TPR) repeat protein
VIPVSQIAAPAHAALAPPIRTVPIRPPPPAPIERPESILQKAISLEQSGDVDGAIKVLERAISRFKKPGPLYNKLAVIVLNQGKDYSRSEELLKKALEHEPDNAVYQQNLFKVVALAATSDNKKRSGGFFARLRGKG